MTKGQKVRVRKAVPAEVTPKEATESWKYEGRERKGLELKNQTGAKCLRDGNLAE